VTKQSILRLLHSRHHGLLRVLAARCARVVLKKLRPRIQRARGNAGCPMHPQPRVRLGSRENAHEYSQRSHRKSPGIPARNGLRLIRALLGDHRLVATVIGGIASAHLAPASERRDHTISPSASASFVRVTVTAHGVLGPALQSHHARPRRVHRIPSPASMTIADAPQVGTKREQIYR